MWLRVSRYAPETPIAAMEEVVNTEVLRFCRTGGQSAAKP